MNFIRYLFCFLFCFVTQCTKTEPPQRLLRIAFNTPPPTADPRLSGDFVSGTLICLTFEGLMRITEGGVLEKGLAEQIDISPDQRTYIFHLRKSLWSDGTPVTAKDFERPWKQILDPTFPSSCSYLFYCIQNARNAREGSVSLDSIGIRAIDDQTLEVILEKPTSYFLSLTAFPSYRPCPVTMDQLFDHTSPNVTFKSNGPFCITQFDPHAEMTLTKNKLYWNSSRIHLEGIKISMIGNESTAWKMFERGELDWMGSSLCPIPPDCIRQIPPLCHIEYGPVAATTFCTFQNSHPYLANRNLRQALSLAINRTELIEQITQMKETAATRFVPPSLMGFRKKVLYQPFDPERSRMYLERALHELKISREQLNTLTLSFRGTQTNRQLAQTIQRHWKQTLDVDIILDQCEMGVLKDRLQRNIAPIALHFWIAQYDDPLNILERFQDPTNSKNFPRWSNPQFTQIIQKAFHSLDSLERTELIEQAEEIMAYDMPLAPIYHWTNHSLTQPWVHNLKMTPLGAVLFEYCWTE